MTIKAHCAVCWRPALMRARSTIVPESWFPYCQECLDTRAEPEALFEYLWEIHGPDVPEDVRGARTRMHKLGGFVDWDDWVILHERYNESAATNQHRRMAAR